MESPAPFGRFRAPPVPHRWLAPTLALLLSACRPTRASPDVAPNSAHASPLDAALPDRLGPFVGGPFTHGPDFARRLYARGATRIDVTIARGALAGPDAYERWVAMSGAYPQIAIDPREGNGFYDCADGGVDAACNAHIQMRSGFHIEVMDEAGATRADVDQLLAVLPLHELGVAR